jgi:hypothetical protein
MDIGFLLKQAMITMFAFTCIVYFTLIIFYTILLIVQLKFDDYTKEGFASGVEQAGLFHMIVLMEMSIVMFPVSLIQGIVEKRRNENE